MKGTRERWRARVLAIAVAASVALAGAREAEGQGAPPGPRGGQQSEAQLGPEALLDLGRTYLEKQEYDRAKPLLQRALTLQEESLGRPDHPGLIVYLLRLASVHEAQEDHVSAARLHERTLAIAEKAFGPDHPLVTIALFKAARAYHENADYLRAEPLYLRGLALAEKNNGPDHPDVATFLRWLAFLNKSTGRWMPSLRLFQRALAIREKALGPDHLDVAESLVDLAQTWGSYWGAEDAYRRALRIREKAFGPESPALVPPLEGLGHWYANRGDYARAAPVWERAMTILRKTLGPNHPRVADALTNAAELYEFSGDLVRAEQLRVRALSILQRVVAAEEQRLGFDHLGASYLWRDIQALSVARGHLADAIFAAQRVTEIQDRNAAALLAGGSEEQKRSAMHGLNRQTDFDVWLHAQRAPQEPNAMRLALTALLRRKARVLDAMAGGASALRQSDDPRDRALLDELHAVYARIAARVSRAPDHQSPVEYRRELAELEASRQTLEARVGERSVGLRSEQHLVTLAQVQAALPEGSALVEIARYSPYRKRTDRRTTLEDPDRYVAYILRPIGDPTFADLGDSGPVDRAVEALRGALADPDLSHDPRPAARALDRLLMEPIRARLGGARWLFMSPDGPLHLVPFAALVDEEDHYLVERYLFSYLTTGRELLRFQEGAERPRGEPLVLANPSFDDSGALAAVEATHRGLRSVDLVTQPLLPLGGTEKEARTIGDLFPGSRVLLGADATEEAVKSAHAPRVLHLATHGFFLPEQPPPVWVGGAPGDRPTDAEEFALLQRENPLLRSGIALAGFNRRRSGADDGVLTALEVAGLDLHGTRLVVLSACESGVGMVRSGEGVYGLRRALVVAGAETQVMSLWPVDTGRTRELMQAYYGRLKAGAGRSEAMRSVQLAMLANPRTSHPNLWASFIVSGDWRTLEGGAAKPDLTVHPGPRGCACRHDGGAGEDHPLWLSLAIGLLATLRRRSSRRAAR